MELTCEIQLVIFRNEDNGYTVAKVLAEDAKEPVTIVGNMGKLAEGEVLVLTGEWCDHPKFGRQFQVASYTQSLPSSLSGIRRFLASGLVKGIRRASAADMVTRFGERIFDVLDNSPDELLAVTGIGKVTLQKIKASWDEQREVRSLLMFLNEHGVPTTYATRIFKSYGARSIEQLRNNPFDLAYDIRGIGFKTADAMAARLGFAPDCRERLEAGLIYALFNLSEKGHLFCPREELFHFAAEMMALEDPDLLERALEGLLEKKRVVVEDLPEQDVFGAVYLGHFHRFEREVAQRLLALATHPAGVGADKLSKLIESAEKGGGIALSGEQRQAVHGACLSKVFVLTGGPGTGKTTITKIAVETLTRLGLKVLLAAPTGRAAKKLSEATGKPASTIHRLLEYTAGGEFGRNEEHKLGCGALIVDEASMLDIPLTVHLLRALPLTSRLILVGDADQLPSVGPGNVLADLLASAAVESCELTHIFRQAEQSMIVVNAHRINRGEFPTASSAPPPKADFYWVEQDDPVKVRALIADLVCERIPKTYGLDPLRDIQVLSPMNKGEIGAQALNDLLQSRLNPSGPAIIRGGTAFRAGDRVLQMRNNYDKDVFNGDLGWIIDLDLDNGEALIDFDGRMVGVGGADFDELSLAYAVSVHKSQGSEYPAIVVPVLTQHYVMLRRNLLYTALTRARRLAILVGGKRAFAIGIANSRVEKRNTHLRYRLQAAFNENAST
jgi:exodeoxyribonuclease V alpha subunit